MDSDGKIFKATAAGTPGTWAELAEAGPTPVIAGDFPIQNLCSNPGFEADTAGWVTYADAAGALPVDATGGSPTITVYRDPASGGKGRNSWHIVMEAGGINPQGQGMSYDFPICDADFIITARLKITAQTTESRVTIGFFDKTNNTIVASKVVKTVAGMVDVAMVVDTTHSYRFFVHFNATGTSTVVRFDDVYIGADFTSGWVPYVPSYKGSTTNPTKGATRIEQCFARRVGNCLELSHSYVQTVGGSGGSGVYTVEIPFGLSIDGDIATYGDNSTATLAGTVIGYGRVWVFSSNANAVIYARTVSELGIFYDSSNGKNVSNAAYGFANSDLSHSFYAKIPIRGW